MPNLKKSRIKSFNLQKGHIPFEEHLPWPLFIDSIIYKSLVWVGILFHFINFGRNVAICSVSQGSYCFHPPSLIRKTKWRKLKPKSD